MSDAPIWSDPTLEAFFQTARPAYDREGGLAGRLDAVFPIKLGQVSVDLASYDCVPVDGGVELVLVIRVALWTADGAIEDVIEQAVGALALPYQCEDGGFAHDGIPLVLEAATIVDRVERYVDGMQEAIIGNWHAWLHASARVPQDLFPPMA